MNIIAQVTADEVLGEWLRHEYSAREDIRSDADAYLAQIHRNSSVIISPNYENQDENKIRRNILLHTGRAAILDWILALSWTKVRLDNHEIENLRTITGNDWKRRTQGTYLVLKMVQLLSNDNGKPEAELLKVIFIRIRVFPLRLQIF